MILQYFMNSSLSCILIFIEIFLMKLHYLQSQYNNNQQNWGKSLGLYILILKNLL